MDGRGRATDKVFIERLWRSVKHEHIYHNPTADCLELLQGSKNWGSMITTPGDDIVRLMVSFLLLSILLKRKSSHRPHELYAQLIKEKMLPYQWGVTHSTLKD